MARWGMLIDMFRCIGCHGCTYACKMENNTGMGVFWAHVYDYEMGKYPNVMRSFLPMLCMHCEDAPCEEVCPSGATYRRDDGLVAVDQDKCINCKACMMACPYSVRFENPKNTYFNQNGYPKDEKGFSFRLPGIVEKCTFCKDRIDKGKMRGLTPGVDWDASPACVNACPVNARTFGDLDDPNSELSKLISIQKAEVLYGELGTNPSVYYISPNKPIQRKIKAS